MINDEANNYFYFAVKNLSELNSSGWLQGKKDATIKNNNNNDFQNALDDSLNYQTIEKDPQRISNLKPYINKYNWEGIDFPAGPKEWKKFEKNNTIALNVLYIPRNTKKLSVAYRSENNNNHKKQVILLMVTNSKKSNYLAVTNLSALLERTLSNHERDVYCLNCFNSNTTKSKLKEHEEICNNNDSYRIYLPSLTEKTLKYSLEEKLLHMQFMLI